MKRKLTVREWLLLGVLAVMLVICGYMVLFYIPVTNQRDSAINEAETSCVGRTSGAWSRSWKKSSPVRRTR